MAQIFRFEEFELDLGRYELRRGGRTVKLEKIPMELLILLVEREGQLVTREDIIHKLWGEDVFVDTRQGINTAIRKIRLALKDDPDQPRILETVVGKGYRLAATVTPETESMEGSEQKAVGSRQKAAGGPPPSGGEPEAREDVAIAEPPALTAPMRAEVARGFFLFIQAGYLIMYGAAFIYFPSIRRLGLSAAIPTLILLVGLIGTAVRIYLLSSVAVRYAKAKRLFRQMFPGTLILDVLWAASPLLVYHKLGELSLIFVAAMVFLPFAQRTLVLWIYGRQRTSG